MNFAGRAERLLATSSSANKNEKAKKDEKSRAAPESTGKCSNNFSPWTLRLETRGLLCIKFC